MGSCLAFGPFHPVASASRGSSPSSLRQNAFYGSDTQNPFNQRYLLYGKHVLYN